MAANPYLFDMNTANTAYNLRKLINPNAQMKLFRITRNLGYPNVYSKYFIHKDLRIEIIKIIIKIPVKLYTSSFPVVPPYKLSLCRQVV